MPHPKPNREYMMKFKNKLDAPPNYKALVDNPIHGGKVWDSKAGKTGAVIATFNADGIFVTQDKKIAARLVELEYEQIPDPTDIDLPDTETLDLDILRARATEIGIDYAPNCGAKTLAERIAKKEAGEYNEE